MLQFAYDGAMSADCLLSMINPDTHEAIVAACLGARAAIDAAEVTAQATVRAAWIQFAAGFLVIVGALAIYCAAVRQVRVQEREYAAKKEAYRFRISMIVDELWLAATVNVGEAGRQRCQHQKQGTLARLQTSVFSMPEEFNPSQWQDHALLSQEEVCTIHQVYENLAEAIRFQMELHGRSGDDYSDIPTLGDSRNLPDGGVAFEPDNAVTQNVKVAEALYNALKELRRALGNKSE